MTEPAVRGPGAPLQQRAYSGTAPATPSASAAPSAKVAVSDLRKAVAEMRRAAITLLAGSLALTGCSDEPAEATDEDVARIEHSLVNGSALAWELVQAETRVARMCMEDRGFEVHDASALHGHMIPDRFEGFASPYSRIPTVEQAGVFGFGGWVFYTDSEEAREMWEHPDYLAFIADDQGWEDPDEAAAMQEWQAMDEEYRAAWGEAFYGPERFAYDQEMQVAFEEDPEAAMADLGPQPPFGGCELETLEVVYGGPGTREFEGEETWYRPLPETPLTWVGDGSVYEELSARYAQQEEDFLFCVEDRGHGEWAFDDMGWLPTGMYMEGLYGFGGEVEGAGAEAPPLSDEAEDADDPRAFEFAMALDFAECAEESGLRDGTEEAWARLYVERLIDREAEVFAWEQEVQGYLADAQDYLAGE
jgi:hypothetical protein